VIFKRRCINPKRIESIEFNRVYRHIQHPFCAQNNAKKINKSKHRRSLHIPLSLNNARLWDPKLVSSLDHLAEQQHEETPSLISTRADPRRLEKCAIHFRTSNETSKREKIPDARQRDIVSSACYICNIRNIRARSFSFCFPSLSVCVPLSFSRSRSLSLFLSLCPHYIMSCIGSSLPLRAPAARFSSSLKLLNDAIEDCFRELSLSWRMKAKIK